jgi:2,4-dienoyl-CoA reductase-like NADH-dependent reductase (Old Yellow Enzyme family)
LGHGYFCSSFLSPLINRRDDEFGGSLENRAKVARGVVNAVRQAVGDQLAVTAKLNMTDGVRGAIKVEEALQTAKWLEEDGGLDAIELTAGSSFINPMYLFRGDVPLKEFANVFKPPIRWGVRLLGSKVFREYPYRETYLLRDAKLFRAELKMPLILLGGITNRESMDLAMAEGFEFVAMGRALLAEPDLINRIQADGDNHSVRSLCNHCNECMPTALRSSASIHTHCVVTGSPDRRPTSLSPS